VLASPDAIGFLRETTDERILVVVSRAPWSGALLPGSLAAKGLTETLYGSMDLTVSGGGIVVPGDGPTAGIWRLA
jgi:alpha-glucosidase